MTNLRTLPKCIHMCMTIGNLPTSYMESLTYEEQLLWFCKFLQEEVIPVVNNNSEVVLELQNWFKTLDVQEEVNNKLEEMAQSGELAEIIAAYIQLKSILVYDNIESMKEASNLVEGSTAKTLGYSDKEDGGGASYKIRKITNTDIVNNMDIIALSDNTLVAEYIKGNIINVKQFGAKGDNNTNDTIAIQHAIEYAYNNNNKPIDVFIPTGTYKINHLEIYGKIKVYGENKNYTILQSVNDTNYSSFINISGIGTSLENISLYGTSDGNYSSETHVEHGIAFTTSKENWAGRLRLNNITILYFTGSGIYQITNINGYLADSIFNDIRISDNEGHGIYIDNNSDFNIQDCFISNNRLTGMYIKSSSSRILNCKAFLNGVGYESEIVEGKPTRYAGIHISSFGTSVIGCHAQENYGHGFQIDNCTSCNITGCVSDANGIIGFANDYNLRNREGSQRKARTSSTLTNNYAGFYFNNANRINASGLSVLSFINTNTYGVQMAYSYDIEQFDGVLIGQGSVDNTSLVNSNIGITEYSTAIINNRFYGAFNNFLQSNTNFTTSDVVTGGTTGSFKLHIPNWSRSYVILKVGLGNSKYDTIALTCGRTNNGINANKASTQNWWTISDVDSSNGTITISITSGGFYGVNTPIAL